MCSSVVAFGRICFIGHVLVMGSHGADTSQKLKLCVAKGRVSFDVDIKKKFKWFQNINKPHIVCDFEFKII